MQHRHHVMEYPKNFPTPEKEILSPQYPYALTKKLGEDIVMHWGKILEFRVFHLDCLMFTAHDRGLQELTGLCLVFF